MIRNRLFAASLATLALAGTAEAQIVGELKGPELPMHPQYQRNQPVSPVFEGWYPNPDGTYTLNFGFFNRNAADTVEIPLGPNNFIEPSQYDGNQPTSFPTDPRAFSVGRGWGVFSVVVPSTFTAQDRVIWTLTSEGRTYSVPGKVGSYEYRLGGITDPSGAGSLPPRIRFSENGEDNVGKIGFFAPTTLRARVGEPVTLNVWAFDNFVEGSRQPTGLSVTWNKHQGPAEGKVQFADVATPLTAPGGRASTTAVFTAPGEYVVRITVIQTGTRDSQFQDHCCWTNGYQRVSVSQ